jgi:hypothetical protein
MQLRKRQALQRPSISRGKVPLQRIRHPRPDGLRRLHRRRLRRALRHIDLDDRLLQLRGDLLLRDHLLLRDFADLLRKLVDAVFDRGQPDEIEVLFDERIVLSEPSSKLTPTHDMNTEPPFRLVALADLAHVLLERPIVGRRCGDCEFGKGGLEFPGLRHLVIDLGSC